MGISGTNQCINKFITIPHNDYTRFIVLTNSGKLYISNNGMDFVPRIPTGMQRPDHFLRDIMVSTDKDTIIAVGDDGLIVISIDAGNSWITIDIPPIPYTYNKDLSKIKYYNDMFIVESDNYAGMYPLRLISLDNGVSWIECSNPLLFTIYLNKNRFGGCTHLNASTIKGDKNMRAHENTSIERAIAELSEKASTMNMFYALASPGNTEDDCYIGMRKSDFDIQSGGITWLIAGTPYAIVDPISKTRNRIKTVADMDSTTIDNLIISVRAQGMVLDKIVTVELGNYNVTERMFANGNPRLSDKRFINVKKVED